MEWTRATIGQYDAFERLGNDGWNSADMFRYVDPVSEPFTSIHSSLHYLPKIYEEVRRFPSALVLSARSRRDLGPFTLSA